MGSRMQGSDEQKRVARGMVGEGSEGWRGGRA